MNAVHGDLRSPHEATCRSIASSLLKGRIMSSFSLITSDKLARLIGTPKCPALIDVRNDEDFGADPRLIPGSLRRSHKTSSEWAKEFEGRATITICQRGQKLGEGAAAWLRHAGAEAD